MNRLEEQAERAGSSWEPSAAMAHQRRWLSLLDEFGHCNGLRRSREFALDALSRGLMHGGSWGDTYQWPGCDHPTFFKRDGRAAAMIIEPYSGPDVDAGLAALKRLGLTVHRPPNPHASFWYPGQALFIVITAAADFGPVQWLPDQLAFRAEQALEMPNRTPCP